MAKKCILAVEAAIENGSLSLAVEDCEIDGLIFSEAASKSVDLASEIKKLLERNNLDAEAISLAVISAGRGSLTGLRVAASLLRGLSGALGFKIVEADLLPLIAGETTDPNITQLIGIPTARSRAEWLLSVGGNSTFYATGREANELESFANDLSGRTREIKIRVHQGIYERLPPDGLDGGVKIENLGRNLAHYLLRAGINL